MRSRATLAGPRLAAVTLPVLHRGQQRERGLRPLQDLIEQRASSWCARAPRSARRRHRCRHSRRAPRSSRPFSAAGTAASDSIGAIAASACCAARGNGEQASGAVDAAIVARPSRRQAPAASADAWLSAFALSAPALSHFATTGSAAAVVAGSSSSFCRACVVGASMRDRPAFHAGDGTHDGGLERRPRPVRRRRCSQQSGRRCAGSAAGSTATTKSVSACGRL